MDENFANFRSYLAGLSPIQRFALAAAGGSIVGFGIIIGAGLASHVSGNRSHSNGQFVEPTITCTATIPASEAGGETEVVFTGRREGDGFTIDTTGLRGTQSVQLDGSGIPAMDKVYFPSNSYNSTDTSWGGNTSIAALKNATLAVVEGGGYTHTSIPISCPAAGRG
jgi:hypothetical protein